MKNFISGFLIATMFCATILTANAATETTIPVTFDAIRVVAEGINFNNTILYDGTTYVPLRQAGELFGKEVTFNNETKTAYIGKVPIATNSTIDTPTPMGITETVDVDSWGYKYNLDVSIDEVMYKDLAYEIMKDANNFNEVQNGYEPIVVKVTVSNLKSNEPIDVSGYNFEVISGNKSTVKEQMFVNPKPAFESTIYEGGSFTGYIIYQIPTNDNKLDL